MREILFRGKRVDNGEWETGSLVISRMGTSESKFYIADKMTAYHTPVIPETVGQYTGLCDKNGVKIFEGDIIRYCDIFSYDCFIESKEYPDAYDGEIYNPDFKYGAVEYIIDDFSGFDISKHNFDCNGLSELICSGEYFYEVIGNIHDNPELLKGEQRK